jgi:hypothetical protein
MYIGTNLLCKGKYTLPIGKKDFKKEHYTGSLETPKSLLESTK